MNKLLTRGGIEIIAVFIGISGGLWSEKQIELKKTLKAEKIALSSIRDELVSDSTSLSSIVSSIENVNTTLDALFSLGSKSGGPQFDFLSQKSDAFMGSPVG